MRRLNPIPVLARLAERIGLTIRLKRALGNTWTQSWQGSARLT